MSSGSKFGLAESLLVVPKLVSHSWQRFVRAAPDQQASEDDANMTEHSRCFQTDDDDCPDEQFTLANEHFENSTSCEDHSVSNDPEADFADVISAEYAKTGRPRHEEVPSTELKRVATEILLTAYEIVNLDASGNVFELAAHEDDEEIVHVLVPAADKRA